MITNIIIYNIDSEKRSFSLTIRKEIGLFFLIIKKEKWKITKKFMIHNKLSIKISIINRIKIIIDGYTIRLTKDEQEALDYEVEKKLNAYNKELDKIGFEKLIETLKKININSEEFKNI